MNKWETNYTVLYTWIDNLERSVNQWEYNNTTDDQSEWSITLHSSSSVQLFVRHIGCPTHFELNERLFLCWISGKVRENLFYDSSTGINTFFCKMPSKRSVFGCFGSRPGHHPEIRYGIDSGQGMHILREFSLPMPEESELNAKFSELVVSSELTVFLQSLIVCKQAISSCWYHYIRLV